MNRLLLSTYIFFLLAAPLLLIHAASPVQKEKRIGNSKVSPNLTEAYLDAWLDHFDESNNASFKLRFFYNNENTAHRYGPCLLFIGGTRPLTEYLEKYRLFLDLMPEMKASVVFVEMRYFGASLPFGDQSEKSIERLQYLSTRQMLRDCIQLINHLRRTRLIASNTLVFSYGAEEGGLLAAWLRAKYPEEVKGAIASSAPVLMFAGGGIHLGSYHEAITYAFENAGCDVERIHEGLIAVDKMALNAAGRKRLNQIFEIHQSSWLSTDDDARHLRTYINTALTSLPAFDFPYQSEAPGNRSIQPFALRKACTASAALRSASNDDMLTRNLHTIISQFYGNLSGGSSRLEGLNCIKPDVCGAMQETSVTSLYLSCKELQMASCPLGPPNDMFVSEAEKCGDDEAFAASMEQECTEIFESEEGEPFTDVNFVSTEYGFQPENFSHTVFTQSLDPYSIGTFKESSIDAELYVLAIDHAARAHELHQPNSCDPPNLMAARFQMTRMVKCWSRVEGLVYAGQLDEESCEPGNLQWELPDYQEASGKECVVIEGGFPWGQVRPTSVNSTQLPLRRAGKYEKSRQSNYGENEKGDSDKNTGKPLVPLKVNDRYKAASGNSSFNPEKRTQDAPSEWNVNGTVPEGEGESSTALPEEIKPNNSRERQEANLEISGSMALLLVLIAWVGIGY